MRHIYFYIAVCASIVVPTFFIFLFSESRVIHQTFLFREDGIVENLTAVLFLVAFLVGIFRLNTSMNWSKVKKTWAIFLMLLGLVGFLDELSFGERLFDLKMPMVAGVQIDAAHDIFVLFLVVANPLVSNLFLIILALTTIAIALFILIFLRKWEGVFRTGLFKDLFPSNILFLFLTICIVSALLMDAHPLYFDRFLMFEEIFELSAAFALLLACYVLNLSNNQDTGGLKI